MKKKLNKSQNRVEKRKNIERRKNVGRRQSDSFFSGQSSFERIAAPELFIGLVGPLGVDLQGLIKLLKQELSYVSYKTQVIKLSKALDEIEGLTIKLVPAPDDSRIHSYMDAGNEYRKLLGRGDALALTAIAQIRELREKTTGDQNKVGQPTVYVFDSIKHKEEVLTLRKIYGKAFFLISVYSPRNNRKVALAKRISKSYGDSAYEKYFDKAENLIFRDFNEGGGSGQNVSDAFPLADLFVDENHKLELGKNLKRFVELTFDHPFHTPTQDEFGLFHAKAAALRSADLSRQVGAAITDDNGNIITIGCNEVPKAGGGLYWPSDKDDHRDHVAGKDSSTHTKKEMWQEILSRLKDAKIIQPSTDIAELVKKLLTGDLKQYVKDTRVSNILEFGRIVHAEMAAITDAARRGLPLQNATLYCTTFPCHMCARHIIASGIKRVVYIEPYPKSKTGDLYHDSTVIDSDDNVSDKVVFQSFMGISPLRFIDFFTMPAERKNDDGDAVIWNANMAKPRLKRYVTSYIAIEHSALKTWKEKMRDKNLSM